MKSLNEIRQDLRDIRYYYLRRDIFDQASETVGANDIVTKVTAYNTAVTSVTPQLFDIYVSLYVQSYTQERLSLELGYTTEHVRRLNKKLLQFFQAAIAQ